MSYVPASEVSAPYGVFQLDAISRQAMRQVRRLDPDYLRLLLKKISSPISMHSRGRVHGCNWEGVFKFRVGNSLRVCFLEHEGKRTIIHVGLHEKFENMADNSKKVPVISDPIPIPTFLKSFSRSLFVTNSAVEDNATVSPSEATQEKLVAQQLKSRIAQHIVSLGDDLLAEYFLDEATNKLSSYVADAQASIREELPALLDEGMTALDEQICRLTKLAAVTSARAAAAEAKLCSLLSAFAGFASVQENVEQKALDTQVAAAQNAA